MDCDRRLVLTIDGQQHALIGNNVTVRDRAEEFCGVHSLDAERDAPLIERHFATTMGLAMFA